MGSEIDGSRFEPSDYERFAGRLREELAVLRELLASRGFGEGPPSLGAEVEFSIVDAAGAPHGLGPTLRAAAGDPRIQLELNRFNLEINLDPIGTADRPFSAYESALSQAIAGLNALAARHGGRIVPVGILPTLEEKHLTSEAMCDVARFHALSAGLRRERAGAFHIHIQGDDTLEMTSDDVTREGAATSIQVHLRVPPGDFARTFNACQVATAPALALAGNSPFFLAHRLWDETRVALFKQSVDSRSPVFGDWRKPPRVGFGQGWVRTGAYELFAENAALFPVLLPVRFETAEAEGPPALRHLRLHQGTVWQWNRAIYDPRSGGHLRIEMRALPSGPTPVDMVANAAFLVGLTVGLAADIDELIAAFPFPYAEYNFYRAAQRGLDAQILWPVASGPSPREFTLEDLLPRLLDVAARGLHELGVADDESTRMLGLIEARLAARQTGARWQRRMLARLEEELPRSRALHHLLERYLEEGVTGRPVAEWSTEP